MYGEQQVPYLPNIFLIHHLKNEGSPYNHIQSYRGSVNRVNVFLYTAAICTKEINICNNSTGSPWFATICFGTIHNKDGFETIKP